MPRPSDRHVVPMPHAADRGRRDVSESARVYAWLRQGILDVTLVPGAVLPESDVAMRFGTSRTPVREALLRLAEEGLIEIRPQRGTYVSRMRLDRLEEALFVRAAVEGAILRELAARHDHVALADALGRAVAAHAAAVERGDTAATLEADAAFHHALVDASGRPGLWDVIGKARDMHHRVRALAAPESLNARTALADHRGIVRAIRAGSGELAAKRLAVHVGRNAPSLCNQGHGVADGRQHPQAQNINLD